MIRLLHTSDWHLGRFLHGKSLIEDQTFALERLCELIDQRRPHALLIAGDVFDRSVPPEEAVTLLNHFLGEVISKRGLPVFLIPGNHDSAERLGFASQLLRDRQLTIYSRVADALEPARLRGDDGTDIHIYGIPFVEPVLIARALERDDIRSHDDAISALCEKIKSDRSKETPAVLLCHAFAIGGEESESEKEISIGGSSQVSAQAFQGFAYTALGHLHKPQKVGDENVRYSGSLLAYSKSEVDHRKSITEVRIAKDGRCEIELHELPCLRRLRYIEGELAEILAEPETKTSEDYIIAGLTDTGAVFDAYGKIRMVYPNLLHVSRVGGFTSSVLPTAARNKLEEKSELELFSEFFHEVTGGELAPDEKQVVIEVLEEMRKTGDPS